MIYNQLLHNFTACCVGKLTLVFGLFLCFEVTINNICYFQAFSCITREESNCFLSPFLP